MSAELSNWATREPPGPVTLKGSDVTVVPCIPAEHGPALWRAFGERDGANAMMRFFPNPPFEDLQSFVAWLRQAPDRGWQTMVFTDRMAVAAGMGSFMRTDPANGVTEIGAVAHGPQMARSRMATEAHYLLAQYVFDDLGYRRYEWKLDDRNNASHRAATRLGFKFEGVFRQHMVTNGENRDTAWYAMTDRDWPGVRQAFCKWLDPSNFDKNGRQLRPLEAARKELMADGRST